MTDEQDDTLDNILKDPRVTKLEDDVRLLQEQVIGIQRILVEARAVSIANKIVSAVLFRNLDINAKKAVRKLLSDTVSALRGSLMEEAIPEDAHDNFCTDLRNKLQSVFTSEQINSLLSSSDSWKKRIGFSF